MEYYSALKRNLPCATAWKNPRQLSKNKPGTKKQLYLEAKKQRILKQIETLVTRE